MLHKTGDWGRRLQYVWLCNVLVVVAICNVTKDKSFRMQVGVVVRGRL